jgi:hypothetical protein
MILQTWTVGRFRTSFSDKGTPETARFWRLFWLLFSLTQEGLSREGQESESGAVKKVTIVFGKPLSEPPSLLLHITTKRERR